MALSARVPSTVDTNKFIPEIFLRMVEEAAKSDLVAFPAIFSQFRDDMKKGDTFYITKTNTVTATEVVVGTKAAALNPFNTGAVTLTINNWWEAPVDIDDMTAFQTQVAMEEHAVKESTYAVDLKIDSTVCDLFSSLGGYSTSAYGSDGQIMTDDILIYLKETLDEANVPKVVADRSLIGDPSTTADMLKIDKMVAEDYVNKGAIVSGVIGRTRYGCMLRETNNLTAATTGAYGVMLHRKAIAGYAQFHKAWVKVYEDLHQIRYQVEALWGVIELRDDFGVPFFTRKK